MQVAFQVARFAGGATGISLGISNLILVNAGTSGPLGYPGLAVPGSTLLSWQQGDVLQIVTSVASSSPTTSSSSPQPSGHSASITPSSSASQILVLWSGAVAQPQYILGPETYALTQMYRSSSPSSPTTGISVGTLGQQTAVTASGQALSYVDTAGTTSPITYQMYYWALGSGAQCTYNDLGGATITLMEIL